MRTLENRKTILVVDDEKDILQITKEILGNEGYEVICVEDVDGCFRELDTRDIDLVLLDLMLPEVNDMEVLREIKRRNPEQLVIMISGYASVGLAVEATKSGAYDFLEKSIAPERVILTVKNALDQQSLKKEKNRSLEENRTRYKMEGESQSLKNIYDMIDRIAETNSRILIQGESGTGKELVARAIHLNSKRAGLPFHSLNCAAIPEELIESELFGHVKGAFTHAVNDKKGAFAMADNSTLFLDEIGDLSLRAQAKVLRAIETGEVTPVGGEKTLHVDVRILSATNQDLDEKLARGEFREDLYHRINVVNIVVPPLRERPEDIEPIAKSFIREICEENNLKLRRLSEEAISLLKCQKWNGNARELRNNIERLLYLTDAELITGKSVLMILHLHEFLYKQYSSFDLKTARENFEKLYITDKLIFYNWNVTKTAEVIGVERTHLYRKMKKLNITREEDCSNN